MKNAGMGKVVVRQLRDAVPPCPVLLATSFERTVFLGDKLQAIIPLYSVTLTKSVTPGPIFVFASTNETIR